MFDCLFGERQTQKCDLYSQAPIQTTPDGRCAARYALRRLPFVRPRTMLCAVDCTQPYRTLQSNRIFAHHYGLSKHIISRTGQWQRGTRASESVTVIWCPFEQIDKYRRVRQSSKREMFCKFPEWACAALRPLAANAQFFSSFFVFGRANDICVCLRHFNYVNDVGHDCRQCNGSKGKQSSF